MESPISRASVTLSKAVLGLVPSLSSLTWLLNLLALLS